MNIREIEIFRAVMQNGSISRAAAQLRIGQPAASKYIAQLERRLKLSLFVRNGNRIAPTPEARALFDQVDRLFLGLNQIEKFMSDLSSLRSGHVTIACLPLLSLTTMPDTVAAFAKGRPDVSVALQTRSSARILEWVAARQIDFGVGILPAKMPGVTAEPLCELDLFCALPPGDQLENKTEISIEDLSGRDLVALSNHDRSQMAIDVLMARNQVVPRRRIEVFWTSVAFELALRGAGIAFVDRLTAARIPGGLAHLRPFVPRLSIKLSLLWPDHWPSSAVSRVLADDIRRDVHRALADVRAEK
ncbi:MAG: LysR family transcriptional regulator [Rhodospirillales bacterium]|jgi:DNA-binding transcriptional LysR family regulator